MLLVRRVQESGTAVVDAVVVDEVGKENALLEESKRLEVFNEARRAA
jgi:hypothetical protein